MRGYWKDGCAVGGLEVINFVGDSRGLQRRLRSVLQGR